MNDTNAVKTDKVFVEKIKKLSKYAQNQRKKGSCPIQDILAPSVDKWSLFVVYNLAYHNILRFNQFKIYIPEISSRMLSVTLKKLESTGMVSRKSFNEIPPRVEYNLTDFGLAFAKKLIDLNLWIVESALNKTSSKR